MDFEKEFPYEKTEVPDDEYPMVFLTGRLTGYFNTRTHTGRLPQLKKMVPDGFVSINPDDTDKLGVKECDAVDVVSHRGKVTLPVYITKISLSAQSLFLGSM